MPVATRSKIKSGEAKLAKPFDNPDWSKKMPLEYISSENRSISFFLKSKTGPAPETPFLLELNSPGNSSLKQNVLCLREFLSRTKRSSNDDSSDKIPETATDESDDQSSQIEYTLFPADNNNKASIKVTYSTNS